MSAFEHEPVLVDLVVELFAPVPAGVVVDATVGGGGHAAAILEAHAHLHLLGLDQDPDAVEAARTRLEAFGARATVRRARFDSLADQLDGGAAVGVLFDLGVSSPQFDRPERGFSYRAEARLDMRMDPNQPTSAHDIVNEADAAELTRILREYGEERYARRIARAIVAARPIDDTVQLAEVARDAIPAPARRTGPHPARRTFQALRIAVNDELDILPAAIDQAIEVLAPGGRCVALSYHSGEDRIVKARFRHAATGGWRGQPGLPPPADIQPTVRLLRRGAWKPSDGEISSNPRAKAARARAVEKLPLKEVA